MKRIVPVLLVSSFIIFTACNHNSNKPIGTQQDFDNMTAQYWEKRMQLFPLEATANGDYRYDDQMTITIGAPFRDSLKKFYEYYLDAVNGIDTSTLDAEHLTSYQLFKYEMQMNLEGMKFPTYLMPINQFWSLTLDLPQLGSGSGNQPFKTVKDYDDFLKRIAVFPAWTDTAISNMREGIKEKWTLPKALVLKIIPQLQSVVVAPEKSIFYGPINKFPDNFSKEDKERLTKAYANAIDSIINPSYYKLFNFFINEYMPQARSTTGLMDIPNGKNYYDYCVKYWTTTNLSPDSIYNIGIAEINRIENEMNRVKDQTGFVGDLKSFFTFLNTDKQFFPFTTPQQVIDSFWNIKKAEDPALKRLFNHVPKSPFTIRQTEAFRAASASAEYNPPSEDGSRPGIFYVPILDAKKYNAVGMETLFLHEAIPGHHYQISLQQENKNLPKFRRFLWYGAYGEGWALYSESLGKELGLYTNPYQYFGHLSDAIHRAIRLVVDVGMHTKGMTRGEAIIFMMQHERISEDEAVSEIERYMAIPGQALSYKIGQLTISGERKKYEKELGKNFNIASFHDAVLENGVLPLDILKEKLHIWSLKQKK